MMLQRLFLAETYEVFPGLPFRSNSRLQYERFIHTFHYPYIMHPHSLFRYYWQCFMCIFMVVNNLALSMLRMTISHSSRVRHCFVGFYQFVFLTDLVFNFITGYTDGNNVFLRPRSIAMNYLRTWFFFDVWSCIPVEAIVYTFYRKCYASVLTEDYWSCHIYIDILAFTYYTRLTTIFRYFRRIAVLKLYSDVTLRIVLIFTYCFIFMTFMVDVNNQVMYTGGKKFEFNDRCQNLKSCDTFARLLEYFKGVSSVLLDSTYYDTTLLQTEVILRIILLLSFFFGTIVTIVFYAQALFTGKNPLNNYSEIEDSVRGYLCRKHLPDTTVKKALLYFQVLFQKKYFREEEIFSCIPASFKAAILVHQRLPVLDKSMFFSDTPLDARKRIAQVMQPETYMPNDVIFRAGERGKSMFIVNFGAIALYTDKNREFRHHLDGTHFGEENLFLKDYALHYSAIATEVTEVFRIDADKFLEIFSLFPDQYIRLKIRAVRTVTPEKRSSFTLKEEVAEK